MRQCLQIQNILRKSRADAPKPRLFTERHHKGQKSPEIILQSLVFWIRGSHFMLQSSTLAQRLGDALYFANDTTELGTILDFSGIWQFSTAERRFALEKMQANHVTAIENGRSLGTRNQVQSVGTNTHDVARGAVGCMCATTHCAYKV